jgi:tetratricopeptide (TPR) repeat protein
MVAAMRMATCILGLALIAMGCGTRIQEVNFPVHEPDGSTHEVRKFWGYSAANDSAQNKAFALVQKGQIEDAFALMTEATAREPKAAYNHYDLAILYEIKADWKNALVEIDEALKLEPSNSTFKDERPSIERHTK